MTIYPDSIYPMFWLFLKVEGLRDEADRAKRECLEVKKIAEEKEVLFKQEQSALRKVGDNCFLVNFNMMFGHCSLLKFHTTRFLQRRF